DAEASMVLTLLGRSVAELQLEVEPGLRGQRDRAGDRIDDGEPLAVHVDLGAGDVERSRAAVREAERKILGGADADAAEVEDRRLDAESDLGAFTLDRHLRARSDAVVRLNGDRCFDLLLHS